MDAQSMPLATDFTLAALVAALAGCISLWLLKAYASDHRRPSHLPPIPEIPGLPVVGNILQLKEKKPHMTFVKWAEDYGDIYSIRIGSCSVIVLNSSDLAKEAMVTRYSSINTRNLSNALRILSADKTMVAMSDYGEFHKNNKKHLLINLLGTNAQKRHCIHRDTMIENIVSQLHSCCENSPQEIVIIRKVFESELFGLAMKQVMGRDVDSIYVEGLGKTMSKAEIYKVLVHDIMEGCIEVDWREFFPYLGWIPNKSFEQKIKQIYIRREAVMKALIKDHQNHIASGEKTYSYIDYLLAEEKALTEKQVVMLIWEPIIEASDTTLVTMEWALYELSKDPKRQDRLYQEINEVCGTNKVTEENLCKLPYLSAIFHETLRKYSPVPIITWRYVHENTELGGYFVPAGSEIAINIYGCNMDKKVWENPEEFDPERFLQANETLDLQKTMAFGGGKRLCPGALQAMLITCQAIARVVQEFEWKIKDGEEANVNALGLPSHKLSPLQAFIKPRR